MIGARSARLGVFLAVCGSLLGCSHSASYRDDRSLVRDQIEQFGRALVTAHYVRTVPAVRVGGCQQDHYAPVQWSAALTGIITTQSEQDRSANVTNVALIMKLDRRYFITTITADHNDSHAVAFATKDRATQFTVTTSVDTVRVDGFASC